jgi:hypothetical protein
MKTLSKNLLNFFEKNLKLGMHVDEMVKTCT